MIASKLRKIIAPLTLVTIVLGGCQVAADESSELKIRSGREVTGDQRGPEAKSTVGLIVTDSYGRDSTCSAALIGPDLLITAAHCVDGFSGVTAFFDRDRETAIYKRRLIPAIKVAIHPDYKSNGMEIAPHDIALIQLSNDAPSTYFPVPLANSDSLLSSGDEVLLAGFGITESGAGSGTLRYTLATYAGKDNLGRLEINDPLRRGACSGDSGGPLFTFVNGRYEVAGVLSGGPIPCRGVNYYTSVAEHLDFILANQRLD
jgi:Trypsin